MGEASDKPQKQGLILTISMLLFSRIYQSETIPYTTDSILF